MKLNEWIENKKVELVNTNGFRSAELKRLNNCKISSVMTQHIFDFGEKKIIDQNQEVEEVKRNEIGVNLIDVIEVTFNIVKPRCRKPESYNIYVKSIA
jgi:hypothetical protein